MATNKISDNDIKALLNPEGWALRKDKNYPSIVRIVNDKGERLKKVAYVTNQDTGEKEERVSELAYSRTDMGRQDLYEFLIPLQDEYRMRMFEELEARKVSMAAEIKNKLNTKSDVQVAFKK